MEKGTKICPVCKNIKPWKEFYLQNNKTNRKPRLFCIDCYKADQRQREQRRRKYTGVDKNPDMLIPTYKYDGIQPPLKKKAPPAPR